MGEESLLEGYTSLASRCYLYKSDSYEATTWNQKQMQVEDITKAPSPGLDYSRLWSADVEVPSGSCQQMKLSLGKYMYINPLSSGRALEGVMPSLGT